MSIVPILIATAAINNGRYRCDVCNKKAQASGGKNHIPKCPICGSKICDDCAKFGLCPDHYNKLDEKRRQDLHILYHNSVERNNTTKSLFLIPLFGIVLMMLFAFYYIPTFSQGTAIIVFLIVLLLFTVLIPVVFISIRNQHEKDLYKDRLKTFFIENKPIEIYNSENTPHVVLSKEENSLYYPKYCPFCGDNHIPEANYCGNCGKRISNII